MIHVRSFVYFLDFSGSKEKWVVSVRMPVQRRPVKKMLKHWCCAMVGLLHCLVCGNISVELKRVRFLNHLMCYWDTSERAGCNF